MHGKDFGIIGMKCEACKAKGSKFEPVPSHQFLPSHHRELAIPRLELCRVGTKQRLMVPTRDMVSSQSKEAITFQLCAISIFQL